MTAVLKLLSATLGSAPAFACEPMVQLGAIAPGPWFLGGASAWLLIAVAVKCLAFPILEKGLDRKKAVLYMLAANVLTTLLGVVALQASRSLMFSLVMMAVVYGVSVVPARRLSVILKASGLGSVHPFMLASVFPFFFFLSTLGLNYASDAYSESDFKLFWTAKMAAVMVGVGFGVALSTLWEEWAIATLVEGKEPKKNWMLPVFRANYLSMFAVLFVLTIHVVPTRLANRMFNPSNLPPAGSQAHPPAPPPPSEAPVPPPAQKVPPPAPGAKPK